MKSKRLKRLALRLAKAKGLYIDQAAAELRRTPRDVWEAYVERVELRGPGLDIGKVS